MARAINKSYIDVFDPKNRNIDGISAPSNNNLVFKLMGCLGPSPGALVEVGDRIYFVEDGMIRGYGVVFSVAELRHGMECEVTGRIWGRSGDWVICYNDWRWLKTPVPMNGFQGIRYLPRLPEIAKEVLNQEG